MITSHLTGHKNLLFTQHLDVSLNQIQVRGGSRVITTTQLSEVIVGGILNGLVDEDGSSGEFLFGLLYAKLLLVLVVLAVSD